jgi:hypothetical protein
MPKIIFWNLRDNVPGFQVQADTQDTFMVSGYSTRMMELFLTGGLEEIGPQEIKDQEPGVLKIHNTLSLLEKVLTHDMFELVLPILTTSIEQDLDPAKLSIK